MARSRKPSGNQENFRLQMFTRRAFIVGIGQGALFSILGARLAWLQVAQSEKYTDLSENNRVNVLMLTPERGQIVDRYGVPLAINIRDYRAVIVPEKVEDIRTALTALKALIKVSDREIKKVIAAAKKSARFVPIEVRRNLSWEEVSKIEVNRPHLSGVSVAVANVRYYPFLDATAHMVGYVGTPSEKDLTGNPVELLPGFKIGKTGLEKSYDKTLQGEPGQREVEVNAVGREVRDLKVSPPKVGSHLTLSIDAELQAYVQEVLSKHRSATAVIMDVHTGAVYAMASHPSFDPNAFVDGIGQQAWDELLGDIGKPLNSKALDGQYPPGSTFKMVTALAGLESGAIHSGTQVKCPGHFKLGRDKFHCWKRWGHGNMNLTNALAESCDTFFYKTSLEVGIDKIAEMARRLGLGDQLGFDISGEKPGLIPDKAWKRKRYGEKWHAGETVVAAIGQGATLTTPLQLVTMIARLVNGGRAVKPWINGYIDNVPQFNDKWASVGLDPYHLKLIKGGMDRVVLGNNGTARGSRIRTKGMEMSGKTGTAQVRRITKAQRKEGLKQADVDWQDRHHALFVGYAPARKPRYACSVVVEHGGSGSGAAAPVARDILLEVQKRDPASKLFKPNGGLAGDV
ncbi:MAG: penicillin-binding protein 2 [Alphaproteobacteria bacterium]|nr:penicillin-binding protein 2 [Alphaproteobacteria bacterium]